VDGIAVDPETNRIFVASPNDGTFVVIDGYTNQAIAKHQLQEGVFAVSTMPRLKAALAVNWDRSALSILDEKTGRITDTIQVGAPDSPNCLRIQWDGGNCSFWGDLAMGVTVSADNKKIYVIDYGDNLHNSPATDPHVDSRLVILTPTQSENR
jgi:DNA-binding beta-propeller fold protein YncE